MKGSEFADVLMKTLDPVTGKPTTGVERDAMMLQAASEHEMPDWLMSEQWKDIHVEADIGNRTHKLVYFAAPYVWSIGTDDDFLILSNMRPTTAQAGADMLHSILPSRRMVNAIWGSADLHLPPIDLGLSDLDAASTEAIIKASKVTQDRLQALKASYGKPVGPSAQLVAGDHKTIVVGPGLDGSHVALYGMNNASTGKAIQPYPGPFKSNETSYMNAVQFVSRAALLDGEAVDLAAVFVHSELHVLVSDQGPFLPFFPNAGEDTSKLARAIKIGKHPRGQSPKGRGKWGTLEWLSAIATSLGIASFLWPRITGKEL